MNPDKINSIQDIQQLVRAGFTNWPKYGRVTTKEQGGLILFNYTPAATYGDDWNYFETVSRGLILNRLTGEVVARPFDKFFNWMQGGRKASGHIKTVTEKIDGSLGITYYRDESSDRLAIATRGSFDGEQAQWATDYLNTNWDTTKFPGGYTYLFEIIYPGNRVVIDYGKREDLVLLAIRDRFYGSYSDFFTGVLPFAQHWGMSTPQVYSFNSLSDIIAKCGEADFNDEGFVVEFSDGQRFKFKGDRYLELHKLISSLSFKNVLKAHEGGRLEEIIDTIPDEFLGEVQCWKGIIDQTLHDIQHCVKTLMEAAPGESRKAFALWAKEQDQSMIPYLFAALDRKDIVPMIYQKHDWTEINPG